MEPHRRRAWEATGERPQLGERAFGMGLVEAADRIGDERLGFRGARSAAAEYCLRAEMGRSSRCSASP